jgi:hypothetical protein
MRAALLAAALLLAAPALAPGAFAGARAGPPLDDPTDTNAWVTWAEDTSVCGTTLCDSEYVALAVQCIVTVGHGGGTDYCELLIQETQTHAGNVEHYVTCYKLGMCP